MQSEHGWSSPDFASLATRHRAGEGALGAQHRHMAHSQDIGAWGEGLRRSPITIGDDVILEKSQSVQLDTHTLEIASRRILSGLQAGTLAEVDMQEISAAVDGYVGPFL